MKSGLVAVVVLGSVLMAGAAEAPRLVTTAKAGVFTVRETPTVVLEGEAGDGLEWTLLDWRREPLRRGAFPQDGRLALPDLPRGYYYVQAKNARTTLREATFCIVPDPATRTFPKDSFYGVDAALSWVCSPKSYALNWYGDDSYAATLDLIRLAGLPHLRERLGWHEVSKKPGEYHWGRFTRNARLAKERGLVVSGMFHDAVPYAAVKVKGPTDLAAVYRFCRDAGAAFGDAMGDWEFWNEPDIGFYPEPVWDYMSAQKAAYLGFRAANPAMPVLNGAVCTGAYGAYEEALVDNDLAKYSNAFNFHTYDAFQGYPAHFARQRRYLKGAGLGGRQRWLTEFSTNIEGHSKGDGLVRGVKAHSYEQELILAELYAKSCIVLQMQGVARSYFFVFGAYNERNGAKDWGIQRRDGSVKPIYAAIATMTEHLVGAKLEGELNVGKGVRAFVFRQPDGSQSVAYWAVSPCDTASNDGKVTHLQRKRIDAPFALAARDGAYQAADWCGVRSPVKAEGGKLPLIASRYVSFVDGLDGLKADVAAQPTGRIENYVPPADEDLSVVMRIEFSTNDFRVVSGKTAVEMDGERGKAKLIVWNLSDEPKTGTVKAEGVRMEGQPPVVALPPMGSASFEVSLIHTNAASPMALASFTGVFNGKRTSRLAAIIRSDRLMLESCEVVNLPAQEVAYWRRNDSATRTKIAWDEREKAVRFDCEWDDPSVDRWFYPFHVFKDRKESFDGVVAMDFEVKMESNKMENDVSCSLLMFIPRQKGADGGREGYQAPNGNWEKRKVSLSSKYGKPIRGELAGFRIGCNPKGTRMTYWIRNLRLFRPRGK